MSKSSCTQIQKSLKWEIQTRLLQRTARAVGCGNYNTHLYNRKEKSASLGFKTGWRWIYPLWGTSS